MCYFMHILGYTKWEWQVSKVSGAFKYSTKWSNGINQTNDEFIHLCCTGKKFVHLLPTCSILLNENTFSAPISTYLNSQSLVKMYSQKSTCLFLTSYICKSASYSFSSVPNFEQFAYFHGFQNFTICAAIFYEILMLPSNAGIRFIHSLHVIRCQTVLCYVYNHARFSFWKTKIIMMTIKVTIRSTH